MADQQYTSADDLTWVTEQYPPFNFMDNGTASGLMVDMVTAITRKAGDELPRESIRFLPWSAAYQTALHEPGTAIFSIAKTPDREDLFSWVGPVVSSDIALYSQRSRNITINTPGELGRYTIGAVTDDVAIDNLVKAGVDKAAIVTAS
ncbi:MAG: ABC transporter substrate-binding protein, partial [Methanomicrobiales archaeon HGW-Methanomicrobiales-4]